MLESFISTQKLSVQKMLARKFQRFISYKRDFLELLMAALQGLVREQLQLEAITNERVGDAVVVSLRCAPGVGACCTQPVRTGCILMYNDDQCITTLQIKRQQGPAVRACVAGFRSQGHKICVTVMVAVMITPVLCAGSWRSGRASTTSTTWRRCWTARPSRMHTSAWTRRARRLSCRGSRGPQALTAGQDCYTCMLLQARALTGSGTCE